MRLARPLTFFLESIAIGAGVLFIGGSALADSSPTSTETGSVKNISGVTSTVIINDKSTTTSAKGQSSSDSQSPQTMPVQVASTTAISSVNGTPANPINSTTTTSPVSESAPVVATTAGGGLLTATNGVPVPVAAPLQESEAIIAKTDSSGPIVPPISVRSNLASAKYSSLSMPFLQTLISTNDSSADAAPLTAQTPAKAPAPVPVPAQPFGMVSVILALFSEAVPGASVQLFVPAAIGFTGLLIVLTVVALAVAMAARTTVVSYGSWLKQTGFTAVVPSGLPAPYSSFAISSMMGYVSAPAPYA